MDTRFINMDTRFISMDTRFISMDTRFKRVSETLMYDRLALYRAPGRFLQPSKKAILTRRLDMIVSDGTRPITQIY
jgi:hypothetical protein